MVKVREIGWSTDLRDGEVDGHFLAKEGVIEGFGVGEEGASLEILKLLNSAAARKLKLEL